MIGMAPDQPWAGTQYRQAVPGRLTLRMRPQDAPERIPVHQSILYRQAIPAAALDGKSRVDQVLRRFSPGYQVSGTFGPARSVRRFGMALPCWDDLEHSTGMSRTFRIQLDPSADLFSLLDELRGLASVEFASPHYLCLTPFANPLTDEFHADHLNEDPLDNGHYAWNLVGAGEALAREPGDTALIVAVVDSGIDQNHREFQGHSIRPGLDTVDLPPEMMSGGLQLFGDTQGRDRSPDDEMGHGTACAAIIGGVGVGLPSGIAGASPVLPIRVLAGAKIIDRGVLTAVGAVPDIDAGVKAAVDLGARVLNLSFGTPESALRPDDLPPHTDVVAYALARGAVLVAASGNSGDWTRYFPAALPGVIAVGSVGPSCSRSTFSCRGNHVALCAPGENISAAGIRGSYRIISGTSFAAPMVSAACCMLLAHAARHSDSLTAEEIRNLLMASARPFAPGSDVKGSGAGILHLPSALSALEEARLENPEQLSTGPPTNFVNQRRQMLRA